LNKTYCSYCFKFVAETSVSFHHLHLLGNSCWWWIFLQPSPIFDQYWMSLCFGINIRVRYVANITKLPIACVSHKRVFLVLKFFLKNTTKGLCLNKHNDQSFLEMCPLNYQYIIALCLGYILEAVLWQKLQNYPLIVSLRLVRGRSLTNNRMATLNY
jgi:hypothetical protein